LARGCLHPSTFTIESRESALHCSKDGIVQHSAVDPPPAGLDECAGANRRGMADDGDEIALAARLDPQPQNPLPSLGSVTRSTRPARFSRSAADCCLVSIAGDADYV
jgi:hypothetical protein